MTVWIMIGTFGGALVTYKILEKFWQILFGFILAGDVRSNFKHFQVSQDYARVIAVAKQETRFQRSDIKAWHDLGRKQSKHLIHVVRFRIGAKVAEAAEKLYRPYSSAGILMTIIVEISSNPSTFN
uniref:Uncharacterized protein n=1 Tax=Vespula pensylvanica TaxID=30213 RepID=A0A834UBQ8_VESPE|nr:hypothetical protein H0235_005605 [Vespula pensylvanica]